MTRTRILFLSLGLSFLALGACNATTRVDEDVDCHNICDRYRDCWMTSYDAQACHDRCVAYVRSDAGNASRAANDCDTCLSGRSCTEAVFPCSSECSSIIP